MDMCLYSCIVTFVPPARLVKEDHIFPSFNIHNPGQILRNYVVPMCVCTKAKRNIDIRTVTMN